jgi:adenylate kinase family enzyme
MPVQEPPKPLQLGRRVVIWGVTGSGKSTLARQLGDVFNLPVVELDAIRHARGWDSTSWEDFRAILTEGLDGASDGWVLEGSYSAVMDVYLSRADTLIWLHLPWRITFCRLLRRTIARAIDQKPLYHEDGPHESWRQTFLSKQSILWWSIKSHRNRERVIPERIAALPSTIRVHELRSSRKVDALLKTLPAVTHGP